MIGLINDAIAATATNTAPHSGAGDSSLSLLMIAGIFVLFYLMLIRPQNKRAKEHRELIAKLKTGDEVVTTGGILGKVVETQEQYLTLTVAEGVTVHVQRHAISSVLPKGTIKSL